MPSRTIKAVAVIGSGTMGMGIAALCAKNGSPVVLLDIEKSTADAAKERMQAGRNPVLDDPDKLALISTGSIDGDLAQVADCDWICEAVVEDLAVKRALFAKLESARRDGSIITTNTSGIPLHAITADMPARLHKDVAVTHFFNPVGVMRLLEVVPGVHTEKEVINALRDYCGGVLGKGLVYAKDTVNFIGNRIGCYWMLAGLHRGRDARQQGLTIEAADAVISQPVGLPPTGLYGLLDLVGLDVMHHVARNLAENLAADDPGRQYCELPEAERAMIERGQLGRKSGGGYYRMQKHEDGSRTKEVYQPESDSWRPAQPVELNEAQQSFASLVMDDSVEGRFAGNLMLSTCAYAADLIPEISDDIVNIDRAMRWGFNWARGPFQLIDDLLAHYDAPTVETALAERLGHSPAMIRVLLASPASSFYGDGHYLDRGGKMKALPPE